MSPAVAGFCGRQRRATKAKKITQFLPLPDIGVVHVA
jgi:hypothetical protein